MEIRINKILGYGWNDFQGFNEDTRISNKFKSKEKYHNRDSDNELTWENFNTFCKEKVEKIKNQYPEETDRYKVDEYFSLSLITQGIEKNKSPFDELKGEM